MLHLLEIPQMMIVNLL